MDNTLYGGSLCLTEILDAAKKQHSAFSKAANGKIYFNINIWMNAEADKFGNNISVQLSSKKESREREGKIYIGNAKPFERQEPKPITNDDINSIDIDGLPF